MGGSVVDLRVCWCCVNRGPLRVRCCYCHDGVFMKECGGRREGGRGCPVRKMAKGECGSVRERER